MSLAGFKYLKGYQLSVVIYDLTVEFCRRWVPFSSRTNDQMVQAARSGKQNIAEGSLEKSLKMYIKLVGVARASLTELLEDYEDYARQNHLEVWTVEKARDLRELGEIRRNYKPMAPYIPDLPQDQTRAVNLLITLINQACYLLDKQMTALEEKFKTEGGYSEKLFRDRLASRNQK